LTSIEETRQRGFAMPSSSELDDGPGKKAIRGPRHVRRRRPGRGSSGADRIVGLARPDLAMEGVELGRERLMVHEARFLGHAGS